MAVPMSAKEEFLRQQLLCAQAARDRIRTPDRWTQHCLRRVVPNYSPMTVRPTQYCLLGSVYGDVCKFSFDLTPDRKAVIHRLMAKTVRTPSPGVAGWNDADGRTHAEVLALLDEVITELKEEIRMEMPNVGALARAM